MPRMFFIPCEGAPLKQQPAFRSCHASVLALILMPFGSLSAEQPTSAAAQTSTSTLRANVGLASQYVFRGISYSQEKPVVQGGADFSHSSGFYAGVWGTALSGKAIQNASSEIDVYGGYAGNWGKLSYDAGLLRFNFPGGRYSGTNQQYDTLEAYASVGFKGLKLKFSRTLTDYFGFNNSSFGSAGNGDSKGSHYIEANFTTELLPSWMLDLHVGRQAVRRYRDYHFTDYRVGLAYDIGPDWRATLAWVGTNADRALYTIDGVDTGGRKWVASIVRSF